MYKIAGISHLLFLVFILQGCSNDRSKNELRSTTQVCDKLFVETYTIFGGGAGGGDRVSEYLTDQSDFSLYVGTFVQGYGFYSYKCFGDTIQVFKVVEEENGNRTIADTIKYSLRQLKRERKFE